MRPLILLLALTLAACSASLPRPPSIMAPPVDMPDVRAGYRETVTLVEAKRYDEAAPRLEYLLAQDPTLTDHYLYYLGVVRARQGDDTAARAALGRLRAEHPRSIWLPAAHLELGRLAVADGRDDDAAAYLTLAHSATWDTGTSRQATLELARLHIAKGESAEAAALLSDLRSQAKGSAAAREARTLLQQIRAAHPELAPSGLAWLDEGRLLLAEGDPAAAEKAVRAADPSGEMPAALMLLADVLKAHRTPAAATSTLGIIVARYPEDPLAPPALFKMGTLFWNRDEDIPAEAAFHEYVRRYPNGSAAADALYGIGRIQQSSGRNEAAIETFERLSRTYPSASTAAEARWRIGWIHYRNRNYAAATVAFEAAERAAPGQSDVLAARYWRARTFDHMNRPAEARALYRSIIAEAPATYYAGRSEERLGTRTNRGVALEAATLTVPPPPASLDPYHFERYRALEVAGMGGVSRKELGAIKRENGDADARRWLVRAYIDADDYPAARSTAQELGASAELSSAERDRLQYPLGFWPLIRAESDRQGLDPVLVVALIRQESLFDPLARSPADARGLMQMLPNSAREEAAEMGWDGDPAGRLYDPTVNVPLGVHHFRRKLDRWGGDVPRALAAYNGGDTAVQKWTARAGDLESDEWVESITYRETRDYVKRVLGHYRAYVRLYGTT